MNQETEHIDDLTETLVEAARDLIEVLGDSLSQKAAARMGGMLPDFQAQQKKTSYQLQDIQQQIEAFSANPHLLESINQTNQLLGDEFYDKRIIQPMVRGLFPVVDLIRDGKKKLEAKQPKPQSTLRYLSALLAQLQQFLGNYGIECFSHEPRAPFDPKTMKPLKQQPTDDFRLNGLVAESLQCGFMIHERILRRETVSLFKLEDSVSQPLTDGKELKNVSIRN